MIGELRLRYSSDANNNRLSFIAYQLRTIRCKKRVICMRIFLLSSFFLCVKSKTVKKYEFTICGKVTRYREYLIFHQFGKSPKKNRDQKLSSTQKFKPTKTRLSSTRFANKSYNFIFTTFHQVGRSVKIAFIRFGDLSTVRTCRNAAMNQNKSIFWQFTRNFRISLEPFTRQNNNKNEMRFSEPC